jgi:acyl-CoA dehydrogenase
LASSTTEGKGGGNVRASTAPIERRGEDIALDRDASVISYGQQADAIVTTARRSVDAAASDQVLVVFRKSDYSLEPSVVWDALGMRGTCSAGFHLRATGCAAQILPEAYEVIHSFSVTPTAHLMWAGAWTGIAAGAVERARRFTRQSAREGGGQFPPGAQHLARASGSLRLLRALISATLARYESIANDPAALSSLDFQTTLNMLKIDASELAVSTVMSSFRACGLAGYRNDTDVSMGRSLRDVLSSPIMISNDRILANMVAPSLVNEASMWVRD